MRFHDSGAEIIIDSGYDDHLGDAFSSAAEEAIIAHYEDFHLFMYGYIPFFVAVIVVSLSCIWLFKTFTR